MEDFLYRAEAESIFYMLYNVLLKLVSVCA
jgi:hypothetical protein